METASTKWWRENYYNFTSVSRCLCTGESWERSRVVVGGERILAIFSVDLNAGSGEKRLPKIGLEKTLGSSNKKSKMVRVMDVKWHPTSKERIATGNASGWVVIWDVNKGSHIQLKKDGDEHTSGQHARLVKRVCWHPNREYHLLSCSEDSTVKLWDLRCFSEKVPMTFKVAPMASGIHIRDIEIDPFDLDSFACCTDESSELLLWDLRMPDRGPKRRIAASLESQSGKGGVNSLNWHPTKAGWIVTGGKDRSIRVWDLTSPVDDCKLRPLYMMQTMAQVARVTWRPSPHGHSHQIAEVSQSPLDVFNVWDLHSPLLPLFSFRKQNCEVITDIEWWDPNGEMIFSTSKIGALAVSNVRYSYANAAHLCTTGTAWGAGGRLTYFNDTVHFPEAGRIRGDVDNPDGSQPHSPCTSHTGSGHGKFSSSVDSPVSPKQDELDLPRPKHRDERSQSVNDIPTKPKPKEAKKSSIFSGLFGRRRSHSEYGDSEKPSKRDESDSKETPARSTSTISIPEVTSIPSNRISSRYTGVRIDGATSSNRSQTLNGKNPTQVFSTIPIGLSQELGQGFFYSEVVGRDGSDFLYLAENYKFIGAEEGAPGLATPAALCGYNANVVEKLIKKRSKLPSYDAEAKCFYRLKLSTWLIAKALSESYSTSDFEVEVRQVSLPAAVTAVLIALASGLLETIEPHIPMVASLSSVDVPPQFCVSHSTPASESGGSDNTLVEASSRQTSNNDSTVKRKTPLTPVSPDADATLPYVKTRSNDQNSKPPPLAGLMRRPQDFYDDGGENEGNDLEEEEEDDDIFDTLDIMYEDDLQNEQNEGILDAFSIDPPEVLQKRQESLQTQEATDTTSTPSQIFLSLIDNLVEIGDVQTAATLILCMRSVPAVFDSIKETTRSAEWLLSYHELLIAHDMLPTAACLIKYSPLPKVAAISDDSSIIYKCKSCTDPIPPLSQIQTDDTCRKPKSYCLQSLRCCVCLSSVKGLYVWSSTCYHGGHLICLQKWLGPSRSGHCPHADCGKEFTLPV